MTANKASIPADIAALSFEDALIELEKLVKQLEDGKAKLDDAVKAYERGAWLKSHCETKLRDQSGSGNGESGLKALVPIHFW